VVVPESAHRFPVPEGHVEIRPVSQGHVGIIVFAQGYGASEFARGPLWHCLERAAAVVREGAPYPPAHQPGAPLRWHHFPHDGSHRATLPGGELRVLQHSGAKFLVHVRRDSCCVFGCATELELFEVAEINYSEFEKQHRPLSVEYRGRRYNLQVSAGGADIAAASATDGTRFSVRFDSENILHLERTSEGVRSRIRTFLNVFEGLPELLWSDSDDLTTHRSAPHFTLGQIRLGPEIQPTGQLDPEIRAATRACFEYLAELRGAGKTVREKLRHIFAVLAERGVRVRGRGESMRKQIVSCSGSELPAGLRTFRWAMATCRKLGLAVSDGTDDVLPFDALHDPGSEFARTLVTTFGQAQRSQPKDIVRPATQAPKENSEPTGAVQVPPNPSFLHPAPSTNPVSDPSAPQTPVISYPIDTWPFDVTEIGSDEAEVANCSGCQYACDPGGAMVDHVNWFGHKMDNPEGFTFEATSLGVYVLEEPPGPVGEEFYQNLATQFQQKCSGGSS
jgi:hypothetical protein